MLSILIIVLIVAIIFGGFGHTNFGAVGWSPAAIILVILLLLYFTGRLR